MCSSYKKVSDLLAAQQGGPSLERFKGILSAFNGRLTLDIRGALMVLIQHWYSCTGTMKVTQADMHKILPVEDDLQGLVIGHYSNGVGGLRDQDTDTMVLLHAGFDGLEKVAFLDKILHKMSTDNKHRSYKVLKKVCRDHGVDPVDYSNRLFLLTHALSVVMSVKTIVMSREASVWAGKHLREAEEVSCLSHVCTLSFGSRGPG